MPLVARFDGIDIYMYYRDHNPPHFHAMYAEDEAVIEIASLAVLEGTISRRILHRVQEWAQQHRDGLALNWIRCQAHLPPNKL